MLIECRMKLAINSIVYIYITLEKHFKGSRAFADTYFSYPLISMLIN